LTIAERRRNYDVVSLLRPVTEEAFWRAIRLGDAAAVQQFLQADSQLVHTRVDGLTPLHLAARNGQRAIVELLLSDGADIAASEKSFDGMTALHEAALEGHQEIVELLLAKGAGIDAVDRRGRTPLDRATSKGRGDVVALLRSKGAKSNLGIYQSSEANVGVLQNGKEVKGRFPALLHNSLAMAVIMNNVDGINKVLTDSPELVDVRFLGRSPLHLAASLGKREAAEALVAKGADVQLKADAEGTTPLQEASKNGSKDIVQLLLAKGADASAKDRQGKTALDLAQAKGYTEVANLLKAYMGIQ
jgi:cytohesin